MTPAASFVELDKAIHNRESFDCGIESLNQFLYQYAARHRAVGISKTMVLADRDTQGQICAFYTLSHTEVERQTLPPAAAKKLPYYPIPVMLIAQLAVDQRAQGKRLGEFTLVRALQHAYRINLHLPSYAVVVDALDDRVQGFYEQYGIQLLPAEDQQLRLFLPMKTAAQLI